jgi:hypothetical protein
LSGEFQVSIYQHHAEGEFHLSNMHQEVSLPSLQKEVKFAKATNFWKLANILAIGNASSK